MPRLRIEPSPYRVRAMLGTGPLGQNTVVDTFTAKLIYLEGRHPEYYVPDEDVDWDKLEAGSGVVLDPQGISSEPSREVTMNDGKVIDANLATGLGDFQAIRVNGAIVGQRFGDGPAAGLVRFDFKAMDAWFEEEEQLFVHVRDPYVRVDVIESSRHVEVAVNGTLVAKTDRPRLVTETGLPGRWYIPRVDINLGLLEPSETQSSCGYKGQAKWWNLALPGQDVVPNVAWGYQRPVPNASKLAGLICFFAEKETVETTIDGVELVVPSFDPSWINASLYLENQTIEV